MDNKSISVVAIACLLVIGLLAGIGASQLFLKPTKDQAIAVVIPDGSSTEKKLDSIEQALGGLQKAAIHLERSVAELQSAIDGHLERHGMETPEKVGSYHEPGFADTPRRILIESEDTKVSLEQQAAFDEIWYRLKDPEQNRFLTLQDITEEIASFPPAMQRKIILEAGRMVHVGELQADYFAPNQ